MYDASAPGSSRGRRPSRSRRAPSAARRAPRAPRSASSAGSCCCRPTGRSWPGLVVNLAGVDDLPRLVERPLELLGGGDAAADHALHRDHDRAARPAAALGRGELRGGAPARGGRHRPRSWPWPSNSEGDVLHTVVIMAAMPTAMMSLVIGARIGPAGRRPGGGRGGDHGPGHRHPAPLAGGAAVTPRPLRRPAGRGRGRTREPGGAGTRPRPARGSRAGPRARGPSAAGRSPRRARRAWRRSSSSRRSSASAPRAGRPSSASRRRPPRRGCW